MSKHRLPPVDGVTIEHMTPADGNVFLDLGFPAEEAENLRIRSRLMMEIEDVIVKGGLKQKDAARRFGVSQPRISDLMRGKMNEFSIDSLVNMLAHAGVRVDVSISAAIGSPSEVPESHAAAD